MTTSPTNAAGDLVTVLPGSKAIHGYSHANQCWFVKVYPFESEAEAAIAKTALAASPAHATGAMRGPSASDKLERAGQALEALRHVAGTLGREGDKDSEDTIKGLADMLDAALSSPAQEGEAAPVRTDADGELRKALKQARQFIANGIELGFIRMPDASTPDPAHGTLDLIDRALAKPEGETGPAVAVAIDWESQTDLLRVRREADRLWREDYGSRADTGWSQDNRDCYMIRAALALAVSPPPSERDQHQGETQARPVAEWHEDYGFVTWWCWRDGRWLGEPAWIGSPLCEDWAGYHTHWTPHPRLPASPELSTPEAAPVADKREGEANG